MSTRPIAIGKLPGALLATLLDGRPVGDPEVLIGPGVGVDAAAIAIGGQILVAKTDPITFATDRAAHYLINVNANDLACLGATPRWLLVTALLPADETTAQTVQDLFAEIRRACAEHGIELVGGHTEITDAVTRPILVGQMLGVATEERLLRPGLGKPGHRLLLTRPIAIEGTALLANQCRSALAKRLDLRVIERARSLLDDPGISVVRDAETLLATGMVSAVHDPTEGGLAMGLRELAAASGCGVDVSGRAIPILPETVAIAEALGIDPLGMLASGSLLAAVPPEGMAAVERVCAEGAIPFAWIGKLTPFDAGFRVRTGDDYGDLPRYDSDEVARALKMHSATT